MLIPCPVCGLRSVDEFHCGGESHIERPRSPALTGDQEWADYLYMRENRRGRYTERWCHRFGCGTWFNLIRDTHSNAVLKAYPMGQPPDVSGESEG